MSDAAGPDPDMSEQAWEERLGQMLDGFADMDELMKDAGGFARGSKVDRADRLAGGTHCSLAAYMGIATAADHLSQLAVAHGTPAFTIRIFAPLTLARAAILGAAQSVWILAGTVEETARRGIVIAADEARNELAHRRYLTDHEYTRQQFKPGYLAGIKDMHEDVKDEQHVLKEAYKRLTGKDEIPKLIATDVVLAAAKELRHHSGGSGLALELGILFDWRTTSAANHARTWTLPTRPGSVNSDGTFSRATASEIGRVLGTATGVLRLAAQLWHEQKAPMR